MCQFGPAFHSSLHRRKSVERSGEPETECHGRGGSRDRTGLRRKSLQNGNFRGQGRRLSAISLPRSGDKESGDKVECTKSRHFRACEAQVANYRRAPDWLAGAGGIEPPKGGIKIRLIMQRFQ